MDVGFERQYAKGERNRPSLVENWRWFRSQYRKELEERGVTDLEPFDDQGRITKEAREAMVDILTPQASKASEVAELTTPTLPTGRLPITPETVPDAPSYFDPEVWKERAQRIGESISVLSPISVMPSDPFGIETRRRYIGDVGEEIRSEDASWLEKSGRSIEAIAQPFLDYIEEEEKVTAPIKGALTTYSIPGTDLPLEGLIPGPRQTLAEIGELSSRLPSRITDKPTLTQKVLTSNLESPEVKQRYDILKSRGVGEVSALAAAFEQAEKAGEVGFLKSMALSLISPIDLAVGTKGLGRVAKGSFRSTRQVEDLIDNVDIAAHKNPNIKNVLKKGLTDLRRKKITEPRQIEGLKRSIKEYTGVSDEQLDIAISSPVLPDEIAYIASKEVQDRLLRIDPKIQESVTESYRELLSGKKGGVDLTASQKSSRITTLTEHLKLPGETLSESKKRIKELLEDVPKAFMTEQKAELISEARLPSGVLKEFGEFLPIPKRAIAGLGRVITPAGIKNIQGFEATGLAVEYRFIQAAQIAKQKLRNVLRRESYDRAAFDINDKAQMLLLDGERVAFGDVFEKAATYYRQGKITRVQHDTIFQLKYELNLKAIEVEQVTGTRIRTLGPQYFPRFRKNVETNELELVGKGFEEAKLGEALGSPIRSQQQRIIEDMQVGIERGIKYESDPIAVLNLYESSMDKLIRDELLKNKMLRTRLTIAPAKGVEGKPGYTPAETKFIAKKRDTPLDDEVLKKEGEKGPLKAGLYWADIELSPEATKQLAQPLGKRSELKLITGPEVLSNITKTTTAGSLDTGQFFIQGMPLLAYRPGDWVKAVTLSLEALVKGNEDEILVRIANSTLPAEARRAAIAGANIGDMSEYVIGTDYLKKIKYLRAITNRVAGAFNTFINYGRLKMFSAFDESITKQAAREGWTARRLEQELIKASKTADALMGSVDTKALGLSPKQRQIENAWLFFAARYTRAVFGSFSHLVGSGATASEARKAMGQLLAGGMLATAGVVGQAATAQGKTQKEAWEDIRVALNPTSGAKFMSVKLGDSYYGIGGAYRALMRTLATIVPVTEYSRDQWAKIADIDAGDPDLGSTDMILDNPLARFFRSKAPQVTGTVIDFIDGEDFVGREFSIDSFTDDPQFSDILTITRRFLPFGIQETLELLASGSSIPESSAALVAESGGLRTVEVSIADKKRAITSTLLESAGVEEGSIRDLMRLRGYFEGTKWNEDDLNMKVSDLEFWQLDPITAILLENHPDYEDLKEKDRDWSRERNFKVANFYDGQEELKRKYHGYLEEAILESASLNPLQPLKHYRLKRRKPILAEYFAIRNENYRVAEKEGLVGKDKDVESPFEKAEKEYNALLYEDDKDTVIEMMGIEEDQYVSLGREAIDDFNYDEFNRRKEYLEKAYGKAFIDDLKLSSRLKLPKEERIYREDRDYVTSTGYWDVVDILAKIHKVEAPLAQYRDLKETNQPKAELFLKSSANKTLRTKVLNKKSDFRKEMRKKDLVDGVYKLDNILYKYGYVNRLIIDEVPNPSRIYRA
jgi:hypothetical protein